MNRSKSTVFLFVALAAGLLFLGCSTVIADEPVAVDAAAPAAAAEAAVEAAVEEAPQPAVVDLGTETFKPWTTDEARGEGSFIKFFAPWCGHCKRLAPAWEELGAKFNRDGVAIVARVDCTIARDVCLAEGVRGYPTLKWVRRDGTSEQYRGARDLESLSRFVDTHRVPAPTPAPVEEVPVVAAEANAGGDAPAVGGLAGAEAFSAPSVVVENGVAILTGDTFDGAVLGTDATWLIKFYAPWCGHCKRLAPIWDELGGAFTANPEIRIGKVDCTQHRDLCGKYEVRGFPTIISFGQRGVQQERYRGDRSLPSLQTFVEGKNTQAHQKPEL